MKTTRTSSRLRHRATTTALLIAAALSLAQNARASDSLRRELAEVAKGFSTLLKARGEESIAVGQFTGPPNFPTSSGPGMAQILSEELKKAGINVRQRAKLGIKGSFHVAEVPSPVNPTARLLALKVKGTVEDSFGTPITDFEFDRTINDEETLLHAMGQPATMPANGTPEERDRRMREALADPQTQITGSRVATEPGSPYAIEVLVKSGEQYKPRTPKPDDGLAFVQIKREEIYAVRVYNDSPHDAAVMLTIDGLNMFTFSEYKNYTHFIIPKKSSGTILGWHRTNEKSDSFQVTEYSKSEVAKLLPTSTGIGTITASFRAAWPQGSEPPADEAPKQKGTPDATRRGPEVRANYDEVIRTVGVIRAAVSVRYSK